MPGRYLLDTNIVIALFAGDSSVLRHLEGAEEVFVPCIVAGELFYGAHKSGRARENLARLDAFVRASAVLGCGVETSRCYGEAKNRLRKKGAPIPENDIWVAAIALEHDLTLITRDEHFAAVERLRTETS